MNGELELSLDGTQALTASVEELNGLCDRAEDHRAPGPVIVHVTGVPRLGWSKGLTVGLVSKWERVVRRFERLGRLTVAVASGDCAGPSLDLLLAADVRIAAPATRLLPSWAGGAAWPGMAVYRLTQQAGTGGIRRAVLLGAPIDADRALALNLIDEVSADPAASLAGLAGAGDGAELAIRRQLMFEASSTTFEDALGAHLAAVDRALRRETLS
ncbi:enoyl-CoA-hydratase DpgB [Nonomuraea gerenzanensis]|uniref:Enoyl-CoA hydratase/isomerase n=1 Tax=Nonomuraea gerenzanensis TaxID=93944 RepID=Q7WZ59_9ACTN|nr:enoyl-CoA-hydratase DpgB [Nonomuraea gerenzanensis]UBU14943.1 enoyl-CoA hydratase/isomerase family protein [Nonomuraea gerenzanensis]CAD91227.1 putative DpgB protein [Nonomuraea gerenzanensis]SBO92681.1 Enoyl-CoA hydratase/isomerase [Nonomuraea gerenzanensis]